MGKYLHLFEDFDEFQWEYPDYGGPGSFVCSAGTFTFNGYDSEGLWYKWKNGDKTLFTDERIVASGDYAYDMISPGNVTDIPINSVGETKPGKYYEPWVSYTESATTTGITGFTVNADSIVFSDYGGFSLTADTSGVFIPYGYVYQYDIKSDPRRYEQMAYNNFLWTNGKVYLYAGGKHIYAGNRLYLPYAIKDLSTAEAEEKAWQPGDKMLGGIRSDSATIAQVLTGDVQMKKVEYNKGSVYLTWDGTYDTTTYSGASIPNYVVDNTRSTKDILNNMVPIQVYVNSVADDEWVILRKTVAYAGFKTYVATIYKKDSDGLLDIYINVIDNTPPS